MNDELISYYVINKEVPMSKGKVAVQVAHVATKIALKYQDSPNFKEWYQGGLKQKKIIIQAKEKDLLKLIDLGFEYIRDNGHTEVESGTLTCVGLPPMTREDAKPYVKRLQLLKDKN